VEHDEDFDSFYEAAFGRIAGQLFLVTGDLQDAEDVTQEAFARASMRWSRLRTYDLPEAWVRRVALRLATDRFRQARRRLVALRRLDAEPRVPAVSVEALALAEELRALPLTWRKAKCARQGPTWPGGGPPAPPPGRRRGPCHDPGRRAGARVAAGRLVGADPAGQPRLRHPVADPAPGEGDRNRARRSRADTTWRHVAAARREV
jgi:hypothetical protein